MGPGPVLARVWHRLPESAEDDDNPDIANYLGSGDLVVRHQTERGYVSSLLVRRRFVQLDWATPSALRSARQAPCAAQLRLRRNLDRLQPQSDHHRRRRVLRRLVSTSLSARITYRETFAAADGAGAPASARTTVSQPAAAGRTPA